MAGDQPKPWWEDHPEIVALRTSVMEKIESMPRRPAAVSRADLDALRDYFGEDDDPDDTEDQNTEADPPGHADPKSAAGPGQFEFSSSTDDDASTHDDAENPNPTPPKPWWQDHPEIEALKARVREEIESRPERPPIDHRDPVADDVASGASVRELRDARDDFVRAKIRYDTAVRSARTLGLSWGRIGTIIGVSRQQLHRRYRDTEAQVES